MLQIVQNELNAFQYDYSAFDGATERINPAHDFSFDLDIFGERSVFQLLNRSSLRIGKERLCDFMENPLHNKTEIEKRQVAIRELSQNPDFCLKFRATGNMANDIFYTLKDVETSFAFRPILKHAKLWKTFEIAIPLFYIIYITLILAGVVSGNYFMLFYLATLGLSCIPLKKIKTLWLNFEKKTKMLNTYAQLFQTVENMPIESEVLCDIQRQIVQTEKASSSVKKLAIYSRNLDLAFAFPVLLLLNPFFL